MRLLLVEDNLSLATWLAKLLRGGNYAIDIVHDAETALLGTDLKQYDLALVDLGLPGISGLDLIRDIRRRKMPLPILILTARSDLKSRVEGLNVGADDYLTKPFEIEELEARIKALLRRAQAPARQVIEGRGRVYRVAE
jgi:two-component system, OmpR family, response regulator TctD